MSAVARSHKTHCALHILPTEIEAVACDKHAGLDSDPSHIQYIKG